MTIASRITDLTDALITALNARRFGASAYEIAQVNGYTGTQAAWLSGKAVRTMTKAQRLALTGTDELWDGRLITDSDTGITWRYFGSFTGRSIAPAWKMWTVPWTTYTPSTSNITPGSGGTAVYRYCVSEGMLTWYARIIFGTGGALPNGAWAVTAPLNPDTGAAWVVDEFDYALQGKGVIQQNGAQTRPLGVYLGFASTTAMQFQANFYRADATYITDSGGNLSVGQTPVANNTIQAEITCRVS